MRRRIIHTIVCATVLCLDGVAVSVAPSTPLRWRSALAAQPAVTATERERDALTRLPSDLRARGDAIVGQPDAGARLRLLYELAREHEAASLDFLLAIVESDPSPQVRRGLGTFLGRNHSSERVRAVLARVVASDPDPDVSIAVIESLRTFESRTLMDRLMPLLEERLARGAPNPAALERLEQLQSRYINLRRGTMLPAFLQTPPPVFAVKSTGDAIRVLAFGDWGTGSANQQTTAAAMRQYHANHPFDFAITLGDNFYPAGLESPTHTRFKTQFEDLYGPLKITFYATLGNHDWGHPDSPAAEVLYTLQSATWRMPATYYTFTAGPVQFFALDTNQLSAAQLHWLDRELTASRARWKVVFGHHHIYSATRLDNEVSIDGLMPLLADRADVYLCGHDHNLQHLKPERGVHFFVAGGGGASSYELKPYDRLLFGKSTYGFAVLEANAQRLTVRLVEHDLNELYSYVITKPNESLDGARH